MNTDEMLDGLPPIQDGIVQKSYRQMQIRLPTQSFLKLEIEAAKRGMSSYKLVSSLLTLYLNGKMHIKSTNGGQEKQTPSSAEEEK